MARTRSTSLQKLPASDDREGWYRYFLGKAKKGVKGADYMATFYLRKGLENNEPWALNEPIGGK